MDFGINDSIRGDNYRISAADDIIYDASLNGLMHEVELNDSESNVAKPELEAEPQPQLSATASNDSSSSSNTPKERQSYRCKVSKRAQSTRSSFRGHDSFPRHSRSSTKSLSDLCSEDEFDDWDLSSLHSIEMKTDDEGSPRYSTSSTSEAQPSIIDSIFLSLLGVTNSFSTAVDEDVDEIRQRLSATEGYSFEGIGSKLSNNKKSLVPDDSGRTEALTATNVDEDDEDEDYDDDADLSSSSGITISDESERERERKARDTIQGPFLLEKKVVYVYMDKEEQKDNDNNDCFRKFLKKKQQRKQEEEDKKQQQEHDKTSKNSFAPPSFKKKNKRRLSDAMEEMAMGFSSSEFSSSEFSTSSDFSSSSGATSSSSTSSFSRRVAQFEMENNESLLDSSLSCPPSARRHSWNHPRRSITPKLATAPKLSKGRSQSVRSLNPPKTKVSKTTSKLQMAPPSHHHRRNQHQQHQHQHQHKQHRLSTGMPRSKFRAPPKLEPVYEGYEEESFRSPMSPLYEDDVF